MASPASIIKERARITKKIHMLEGRIEIERVRHQINERRCYPHPSKKSYTDYAGGRGEQCPDCGWSA